MQPRRARAALGAKVPCPVSLGDWVCPRCRGCSLGNASGRQRLIWVTTSCVPRTDDPDAKERAPAGTARAAQAASTSNRPLQDPRGRKGVTELGVLPSPLAQSGLRLSWNQRLLSSGLQTCCQLLAHSREEVSVQVQGHLDTCVTHQRLDDLRVGAFPDEEGRVSVS